jgi:hypothetical protein
MLKIIGIIAGVIAIVVIGVLAYAATLPNAFRVERSISIKAPPEKIFPLINELKAMNEWNPFAKQDPSMKITYSGPASGKGAAHAWTSDKAGEGRLEITDTAPPSRVNMRLDMIKPMEGHNAIVFALQPQSGGTNVSWAMSGEYNFITKVVGLLFNMDRMIGGEFDKGLADLKAMAEKS